jgi:GrpB-like predicted nucleotidyltransferase (UPF0157 family)
MKTLDRIIESDHREACTSSISSSAAPMPTPLVITEYDPQWPILFEELRVKFSELLGDMVSAIEHVGSTSVPGLAAKPIIDLDVLLASATYLPETIRRLSTLGYEHQGDLGIAGREAFRTPPTLFAHHLYVCLPNHEEFRRHILLRNYLRSHPAEVSAYSRLKWDLFAKFNKRTDYIKAKAELVKKLLQRAIAQYLFKVCTRL